MRRKREEEVREEKGRGRWGREAGRIGGRGREERGFILRLFVRAASRTTARRENRAPSRVMSDESDETRSKKLHSGRRQTNRRGRGRWRKRKVEERAATCCCCLHDASRCVLQSNLFL